VLGTVLLIFAAAELALDLNVSALAECGRKLAELAIDRAAVPFSARLPIAGVVLPGTLRRDREDRVRVAVAGELLLGVLSEKIR
jgi:hypothetical protein